MENWLPLQKREREREHYHPNAGSQPSKLVVTIPTGMPRSDSERSVLNKGLSFVPVKRGTDEYQARADCEHVFRRLRLKAHFRNNEESDAQPAYETIDPFEKFNRKESTWTPPDGQFSALDHYIDRCRRSVNAVDFKARAQFNNLSPAEKEALIRLSKPQRHMSLKRAVVVLSRPLYLAEANRQLSDGRFYESVDHDLLKENQNVVKTTITEMIRANKLPPSAEGSIVPTPHGSTCFLRSTKQATLADQLFQRVVVPPKI